MLRDRKLIPYISRFRLTLATLLVMVTMGMLFPVMASQLEPGAVGHPVQVGPVNPENGYPVWYKDETGKRMQLCLDLNDPMCALDPAEIPNPAIPISFPDNYPSEAFYQLVGGEIDTAGGIRAVSTYALEAAFLQEIPRHGDQIVFGRVRFVVRDLPSAGVYRITHPYGQDIFTAESDGDGAFEFRFTEDIGGMSGSGLGGPKEFRGALNSRVGPFLQWDTDKPEGYLGDPNIEHTITGSPYVDDYGLPQNYFRIEGPFVSSEGPFTKEGLVPNVSINDPNFACENGVTESCIETKLFSVMGQEAVNGGVGVEQATYSRTADGAVLIDVLATSIESQALIVRDAAGGTYFTSTQMRGDNGRYFARVKTNNNNAVPPQIRVENISDNPVSSIVLELKDRITAAAEYNSDTNLLKVTADSSDDATTANLSVLDFGTMTNMESDRSRGELNVNTQAPPLTVTVNSSAGGTVTVPVSITGAEFAPIPIDAFAGVDQTIITGTEVLLDGSGSSGDITGYSWTQTGGPQVTLNNANSVTASFIAPAEPATLTFQLTVDGPGGPKSDSVTINVVSSINLVQANAGADQEVAAGATATLDGTGSKGDITGYAWTQKEGPAVTLANANAAVATFTAPTLTAPATLVFELTVQGAGGPQIDTVTITVTPPSAPMANAGTDRSAAIGETVTLDGSGSTGAIDTYSWVQTAGPLMTLANANTAVATFTVPSIAESATFVFELTVQGPGGSSTSTVSITATPTEAPIANAGEDRTAAAGSTVTLDGSASTGVIDSYSWVQTGGLNVTLTNETGVNAAFTAPDAEATLTFELTVRGPGGSSTDTITITVTPAVPPVAVTGEDQTATAGKPVLLDGSGSTGTIETYSWVQTGGLPTVTLVGADTDSASFTAPVVSTPTTLVFQLTVTGPLGSDSKTVSVFITPPEPPVANAGADQTEIVGHTVTLSGSSSTGYIDSYTWTQTSGPAVTLSDVNSATPTFTAPDVPATLTFELTVQGPGGNSTDTVTITVKPAAPVANAGGNQTLAAGATVTLDGSGSTGEITSYLWTQTDGPAVTLTNANSAVATFTAPNTDATLTFELTVEGPGGSASNVVTIDVRVAPIANAGADQTAIAADMVTLDGSGSTGAITSYAWTQTSGPLVTLTNANSATATFSAPNVTTNTTLVFELTVQGPGGTSTSTVSVFVKPPAILTANAGVDQTVLEGLEVTLDGSGSSGEIDQFMWTEATGAVEPLYGVKPTFTAPRTTGAEGMVLNFTLTVSGPGGSQTSNVTVTVKNFADAGPDQKVAQGSTVTLSGSASIEATSYSWTQISGPTVTLIGADTANPTFVFPKQPEPVVFELTTRGPLGTDTDTVQISTDPDVVQIELADFRTSTTLWRIEGTSTVFGPNVKIAIYMGETLLATVDVDTLGEWKWVDVGPVPTGPVTVRSTSGGTATRTVFIRR